MSDSSHAAPAGDRKRRIIESTLAFFASVIRSGEPWTMECIDALDRARTAVAALSSGETPAEPTPDFRAAAMDMGLALGTLGRIIAPGQDWDGDGRPRDQQIRDLIAAAKKLAGSAPPATEPGAGAGATDWEWVARALNSVIDGIGDAAMNGDVPDAYARLDDIRATLERTPTLNALAARASRAGGTAV